MQLSSAKQNLKSSPVVLFHDNDRTARRPYIQNMGRKRADTPSTAPAWDWYLTAWMETLRVNQTELRERTQWSKTATSEIQNGKTGYSKRLINEAANALNIQPYELLLHPEDAMAIRQLIANADQVSDLGKRLRVVASNPARTGTEG